jgi:hypothetical protein
MKTKKDLMNLVRNGLKIETVSKLNDYQVKILSEKFKKQETDEAVDTVTKIRTFSPGEVTNAKTKGESLPGGKAVKLNQDGSVSVTMEGEMTEKFESKAQQGLFWAKCNRSKGKEKKKWCDMAREFSDDTTEKEYEDIPKKKHPEKKVEYKKDNKKTKKTKSKVEEQLENKIVEMLERHVNPSMSKGELLKVISEKKKDKESMILKNPKKLSMFSKESGIEQKGKMKTPIGKLFSTGKSLEEETKEKERTKEKTKTPTRRRDNPFKDPNPGVKEKPKADTKEKERTKEKIKTPTRRRDNPFKDPNPGVKEKPKADVEKQKNDFMSAIKQAINLN